MRPSDGSRFARDSSALPQPMARITGDRPAAAIAGDACAPGSTRAQRSPFCVIVTSENGKSSFS